MVKTGPSIGMPPMPAPVTVVITVLNEAKRLQHLLDSLSIQEPPFEVVVVDAGSTDGTQSIVRAFAETHPGFRLLVHPGSRGASRNEGARHATGDYLAFTDGDCIVNPFWLQRLRQRAAPNAVVAGQSIQFGYWAFEGLERVELSVKGQDVTYPSSNLFYPREAFRALGGFDARFVTAEDIDLNYRAVQAGLRIVHAPDAIVYHRARDSVGGFLRQAFWNGYGRKQLTLKHGQLWSQYSFGRLLPGNLHFWGLARLASAVFGYLSCRLRESRRDWEVANLPVAREVHA